MPKKVITKEIEEYIRKNYLKMPGQAIAQKFGIDKGIVYRFMKHEGLKVDRAQVRKWAADKLKKPMTEKEKDFIHKNIQAMSIKSMSKELHRTAAFISRWAHDMGYGDLIEQRILRTAFKPGSVPIKKNTVGTISIRKDSNGRAYKHIKIDDKKGVHSNDNWKMLHVHNWEERFGPAPDGMIVVFVDGDPMNCELGCVENLEMITLQENMRRNSIANYPEDIKKNIMLTNKLQRKINEYEQHHGTQ